jgi:hypothetical protein
MNQVFMSYSRNDSGLVDSLYTALENNGFDIWLDRADIHGGEDWREAVSLAIRACTCMIAVLSPSSLSSKHVKSEILIADDHEKKIIPIVAQPCPLPPGLDVPLTRLNRIDFTKTGFPNGLNALQEALTEFAKPSAVRPPSLTEILPGAWQVQLSVATPFGNTFGLMGIQLFPNGQFMGQAPPFQYQGGWRLLPYNQLGLQGQMTNGFQTMPYFVRIQFTQISPNQLDGYTSGFEHAVWQRMG